MNKKKTVIPVVIVAVVVMLVGTISFLSSKSRSISVGRYLVSDSGAHLVVLDRSPVQMSNRSGRDLFDGLDVGDRICVLHDGIAESYPGKTGVYAVIKLEKGSVDDIPTSVLQELHELGWLTEDEEVDGTRSDQTLSKEDYDVAVAYVGWTDCSEIHTHALNADLMSETDAWHLPVYKFDTLEDLEQFKQDFDGEFAMDRGYDEAISFHELTAAYDRAFFEANTLMLVYVESGSGSYRFGVNSVTRNDSSLLICVEQANNPGKITCDMAGWFVTVAVPDSLIADCTAFDAVFASGAS